MVPFLNQESSEKRSAYLFSLTTTTLLHNHPLQRERERERDPPLGALQCWIALGLKKSLGAKEIFRECI